jgi:hypothetical protein
LLGQLSKTSARKAGVPFEPTDIVQVLTIPDFVIPEV